MRTIIFFVLAFVVMSCTTNVVVNDEYDGYTYDGAKLIKWTSENNDTVVWYDWSPSELFYIGNGRYTYMGYPCVIDENMDFEHLEELQELDEYGQYSDTYYELLSVISPVWVESEGKFTIYHW